MLCYEQQPNLMSTTSEKLLLFYLNDSGNGTAFHKPHRDLRRTRAHIMQEEYKKVHCLQRFPEAFCVSSR